MRALADRQQIIECINRYTRGVDRLDDDLALSAFHEDAVDHHGDFVGRPREFIASMRPRNEQRGASQHFVSNHTIDLEGDVAHVETYFFTQVRTVGHEQIELSYGRYIDRFERRSGAWKIARRHVVIESHAQLPSVPVQASFALGSRDADDISYRRDLNVSSSEE
jgi:hypothetical protein